MLTYGHMYGPPGVLGIWREGLFIFRVLGSTDNYLRELGSKLVVLGSPAKRKKKEIHKYYHNRNASILFNLKNNVSLLRGGGGGGGGGGG